MLLLATACGGDGFRDGSLPPPAELDSYRFEARMEEPGSTLSVTGAFMAPDRLYAEGEATQDGGAPEAIRLVVIEGATWYDTGSGWQAGVNQLAARVTGIVPAGQGFNPGSGVYPLLGELPFEHEGVGDFTTRRFALDGRDLDVQAALLGPDTEAADELADLEMTVWVDESTGRIVRSATAAGDFALSWELWDLNTDRIQINPPQPAELP